MWRNLLPQGTRTIELASGIALVLSAVLIMVGSVSDLPEVTSIDSIHTWTIVLTIFGFLQILSIYEYPKLELVRTAMSWSSGCFWLWAFIASSNTHITIEHVATLMLGIGNLYGFILNLNLLHISWTD